MTDSFGIGVYALMCLVDEPANGLLPKWEDALIEFVEEKVGESLGRLTVRAAAAAAWPAAVARGLAPVVHGLSIARKSKRRPLPDALAAIESLLTSPASAAAPPAGQLAGEAPAASTSAAEAAGEGAANGGSGGLTRLVGKLDRLAVEGGGDAALARLRKHMNAAFLSLMMRLETKYAAQGHAPLPKEMPEHGKIEALAPRRLGALCGHAFTRRIFWNAAKHDRNR